MNLDPEYGMMLEEGDGGGVEPSSDGTGAGGHSEERAQETLNNSCPADKKLT